MRPRAVCHTDRSLPCLLRALWCAVTRHHRLDISSVCPRNQDPSACAPESSDFGERCILQLQAALGRMTAFEAYGVWFAGVAHSDPEQLGASGHFSAFYPFLVGCGGLARRLCGHQIEFGASLRPHLDRKLGRRLTTRVACPRASPGMPKSFAVTARPRAVSRHHRWPPPPPLSLPFIILGRWPSRR